MGGAIEQILQTLAGLPPILVYLVIGVGAAVENIVPPIPADTFVLFGAFLAANGRASPWVIFLATWLGNVATAFGVFLLARRHSKWIATAPFARWVLQPQQLDQIRRFYDRFGMPALALSRFLPAFRAVVPVFAGLTRMRWYQVLPPVAVASGLWYGALVILGTMAGQHWGVIIGTFERFSMILAWLSAPLVLIVIGWWWRTRRRAG